MSDAHSHTKTHTHWGAISLSKLGSSNLVLHVRPLRGHQGKVEINKVAVTTVPSLKETIVTRATLKHSQLLSVTQAGTGCEKSLWSDCKGQCGPELHTHTHTQLY